MHAQPAPGPVPSAARPGAQGSPHKSIRFSSMTQEALARPRANTSPAANPAEDIPATDIVCLIASCLRFHCLFFIIQVIDYLAKKGYSRTEAMLRMESANQEIDGRPLPPLGEDARPKFRQGFGKLAPRCLTWLYLEMI